MPDVFVVSDLTNTFQNRVILAVFFAPPFMRNPWSQFFGQFQPGFSPRFSLTFNPFRSIFCHFQSLSINFCRLQPDSFNSNLFRSVWLGQKMQEFIDNWKVGETTRKLSVLTKTSKTAYRKNRRAPPKAEHRFQDDPRGPESWKKSISLERLKFSNFRLTCSISLENFNLAWNVQSRPWEFPTKKGFGGWLAWNLQSRLKMSFVSISLENFNPRGRSWNSSRFGPSGLQRTTPR